MSIFGNTFLGSSLFTALASLFGAEAPEETPARVESPPPVTAAVEEPASLTPVDEVGDAASPLAPETSDAPLALAQAPSLDEVITQLQRQYEGTTDFSATFTQRFTYTVMRRTQESQGTVLFKKPGLMRWDYVTPTQKVFVVADDKLTIWQKEDNTVLVDHCFKQDGLTASVSFLWGAGRLKDEFTVTWFPGVFGEKTDHHLQLEPKQKNSVFVRMILVVDPKTFRVKQSVLVDPQGNVNQFLFKDLQLNRGLKRDAFQVTLPKGLKESRIPGSCDPHAKKPGL